MDNPTFDTSGEQLWLAFREGSENAFDLIYEKMFPVLFNYGYRLCQDEELVKDCIQNIFVEIWQKRDQVKKIYSLKHYFLKILRRKVFKTLKNSKTCNIDLFSSGPIDDEYKYISLFQDQEGDESGVSPLMLSRIQHAISHLSSRKKEAILLKFYENLNYVEISEVMELKEAKYARQLIYRTLDELRKQLVFKHNVSTPTYPVYSMLMILMFNIY